MNEWKFTTSEFLNWNIINLQIKVINSYMTIVFKASLHPYIWLTTFGVKNNTLI
jgi:hypothetical protein